MKYSEDIKNARLKIVTDSIDAGATVMKIYSGSQPETVSELITDQVMLCELSFAIPCSNLIDKGIAYMNGLDEKLAVEGGDVSFARVFSEDGEAIIDLSVSEISSDLTVGNPIIYKGAMIRIVNWTLSD